MLPIRSSAAAKVMLSRIHHDIGKLDSDLGVTARVLATMIGPRGSRLTRYHDHVRLGVELLGSIGSDPVTVELVSGRGDRAEALADADDI